MTKKLILLSIFSIILVGCKPEATTTEPEPLPVEVSGGLPTDNPAAGIAPAGTPLPENAPAAEWVKVALAAKYPAGEMDSVEVKVVQETETHFEGVVTPAGNETGGGYVYAFKDKTGIWKIVADGQGSINCDDVDPYDFPTDMVEECLDEDTGEIITR